MFDSWADTTLSACDDPCARFHWGRAFVNISIAYVALATISYTELGFRDKSVEVEGRVETIGVGPKPCCVKVRYHFTDPVTHQARMSTTSLPTHLVPKTPSAIVQYIPGDMPSSRLKVETRASAPSVFFWVNVVFGLGIAGLLGYIAWEANHPIPRPRNRVRNYPLR